MALKSGWLASDRRIRGLLLDITGVLYESGADGGSAIPGSVDAIKRLRSAGVPLKFLSNETQVSRVGIVKKLRRHGFDVCVDEVITPCPAVAGLLRERNLRPHLLVHPDALAEFDGIETENPNCVVVGDCEHHFTYENVNAAFRTLIALEEKILFALGKGKYYQQDGELTLDLGPYTVALEYATGAKAEVVGKPSSAFFRSAADALGLPAEEVAMVGDDVESDVGGAQALGMAGILVRTGKYRPPNESHPTVKPDAVVDNLSAAVDNFLSGD